MQTPTMKTHGHLAAIGAVGVSGGCVALYGLFFWISSRSPTGGIDYEHSIITRVSLGVIFAALIAAHVVYARQLYAYYREHKTRP